MMENEQLQTPEHNRNLHYFGTMMERKQTLTPEQKKHRLACREQYLRAGKNTRNTAQRAKSSKMHRMLLAVNTGA